MLGIFGRGRKAREWAHLYPAPQVAVREAETHDLSGRCWGCNYNILDIKDGGRELRLAVWMTPLPRLGDFLILKDGARTTRYKVRSIDHCWNPRDMAFIVADFAPRPTPPAVGE